MPSVNVFKHKKTAQQKIVMLTCYDYSFAKILNDTTLDSILVGDSCAMVMHGYPNTTFATMEMLVLHTKAVAKGAPDKCIVADMPFMSYRKSRAQTMDAVMALIQAGACAVKLEGACGNVDTIQHIVESGVPVMGQIGLTPQKLHTIGGFKPVKNTSGMQAALLEEARVLQEAGCFALVLECITSDLTQTVTQALSIPTIGIGSGKYTDGQILVLQDMLGMNPCFQTKFLKHYLQGHKIMSERINAFAQEVQHLKYPVEAEHTY